VLWNGKSLENRHELLDTRTQAQHLDAASERDPGMQWKASYDTDKIPRCCRLKMPQCAMRSVSRCGGVRKPRG